ncbi:MAG: 2-(1,2-epoxy-1,2-dihydrophenyl)acetyl-CoA isomerase PaaG [Polyangiaceae bacterium]|nr:2-(1,2-epoxy-1,2-dihydrophenyl)acetyl-CoA isomerase PaaG [Polyangiaceae bacterium]
MSVREELKEGVLCLTLNRPEKLNAFNEEMHLALRAGFQRANTDHAVRAVMLTGSGRAFCVGQNLADCDPRKGPQDLGHTVETFYNPLLRLIRRIEKPIVCAVNGIAAGAGANLALACDITLAAHSARFIQAFAKIGLVPDSGGTWILPRLIGEARAKALALTAEPLSAEMAANWGLIWRAVPDDKLIHEAMTLATAFAAGPTKGLGMTKRAIQAAATNSLDQQLDLERDLQGEAGRSADFLAGAAAFFEKRKPEFKGQ